MNIGIEIQRIFRPKKHGMEIVSMEVIRELQQLDKDNKYFLFSKKDLDEGCLSASDNFSIDTTINGSYPVWEQIGLPRKVSNLQLDFLHCTSNTAPLLSRIPTIITIHDVIYMESVSFKGSAYQNFGNIYRRLIVPRVAKKATIILTVSEYEKQVIAKTLNIAEHKIRVIYNGVNQQFKTISDTHILQEFGRKYNLPEKFILHFGNTAPKKNTIGVLKAFKIFVSRNTRPLPLVITDCEPGHIEELLKTISAPELATHIVTPGYVPFSLIPQLYNLATIFLYPSHRESFGMPVIEAMACGVPVITSDKSALPEIAGGAACLINPDKPEEITDQLELLLGNKNLYESIREKGFVNANRFSWRSAALKTLEVYNEMKTIKA